MSTACSTNPSSGTTGYFTISNAGLYLCPMKTPTNGVYALGLSATACTWTYTVASGSSTGGGQLSICLDGQMNYLTDISTSTVPFTTDSTKAGMWRLGSDGLAIATSGSGVVYLVNISGKLGPLPAATCLVSTVLMPTIAASAPAKCISKKEKQMMYILIGVGVGLVLLLIIVAVMKKNKKQQ